MSEIICALQAQFATFIQEIYEICLAYLIVVKLNFKKNKCVNKIQEDVKLLNKNFSNVNNATEALQQQVRNAPTTRKKPNLIPRNYRQFFFTMLSNQEKWKLVFEKLIDVLDRTVAAVQNQTTEVTESKK